MQGKQGNIILLAFGESSKASQALGEVKQAAAQNRVQVKSAAVVERDATGVLRVRDGDSDGAVTGAPLVGTLLGGLLGILGGPLGVLLCGATGAALGSLASQDQLDARASLLEQMTHAVPPGATAVFISANETDVAVIDDVAAKLGGMVLRRPEDAVQAEMEAARTAQDVAAMEARKALRAGQREEWRGKFDDWRDEVGAHLAALREKLQRKPRD